MNSITADKKLYTVSQLNRQARQLLETHLSLLWVEGEISNYTRPASGHSYFTLKDSGAQIRCAMFKNRSLHLRIQPKNGAKVLIRGRVSLYEGRGDYQLIAEHMEDAGLGALQRAFEELKERLALEGLFDPRRKKKIPLPAKHIAIITSGTGAALRDILAVFKRRWAGQPLTLIPVPVQGTDAAPAIVKAIEIANQQAQFDVILLARGGGSLEDLWSFNEESVARAIAQSRLPVVCGVGHETDTTIADYCADLRAPTPSAAAELLSPDASDWLESFTGFGYLLEEAMERKLKQLAQRTDFYAHRLNRCEPKLLPAVQQVNRAQRQLHLALNNAISRAQVKAEHLTSQLQQLHPARQLQSKKVHFQQLEKRLHNKNPTRQIHLARDSVSLALQQLSDRLQHHLNGQQHSLHLHMQSLHNLSPLQTLERGYALITNDKAEVITKASQLKTGERVRARLHEGEFSAIVESAKT
ncbi:exodeoxyribonuclease VII large subunit [Simiduia curdlanivorans]|uniref:Exodeoxyribonuclease 7 large subunit n=1 Tax=Simiduia curdlanivorans TaxID=1492769 RepID=A0ABV8V5P6_9GAMM|nr:exodeoxyribonuclease VII large subunit [Simiduia curdlanivorans]MDN3639272.1 exodeoxyribonuclease VII large subunit [Simiduia curdlanivorans]